jgi:two-component system NtrC family sensor kinase
MTKIVSNEKKGFPENILRDKHFKDLRRNHAIRLALTYILPFIFLIIFFQYEYNMLLTEGQSLHMKATSENQANILGLYLRERVVNLLNLIDDPNFIFPPTTEDLEKYLKKLSQDSDAFIDIGFFDTTGIQISYSGPMTILKSKDYSKEPWYINLRKLERRYVITDIYLGLRNKPHFTIAVNRVVNGKYYVIKSSLDPQKIYEFMTSSEQVGDVNISIVNRKGHYQLVSSDKGKVLDKSPIIPKIDTKTGISKVKIGDKVIDYAYSWLDEVDWAVIVSRKYSEDNYLGLHSSLIIISLIILFILVIMVIFRANKIAQMQIEKDIARSQLEHASKLASVGELAGGIAHEINNPLAIIASEVGLIKDKMDPKFGLKNSPEDLEPHLEHIHEAVFRCRDITRKLLSFVRQDGIELRQHNINDIINDLIDGFFEREFSVSNIEIIRKFQNNLPIITTDSNQLKQVFLNIINNAADAITPPGKITISTSCDNHFIIISISDTGKGIKEEDIGKIFMPFFTTKDVGKGTGLGLSVSYGIIKNLGGNIEVESIYKKGTTFTIKLPY